MRVRIRVDMSVGYNFVMNSSLIQIRMIKQILSQISFNGLASFKTKQVICLSTNFTKVSHFLFVKHL